MQSWPMPLTELHIPDAHKVERHGPSGGMGHNRPENQISLRLAAPEKTGKSGMGHVAHDQCDNFDGPDGMSIMQRNF